MGFLGNLLKKIFGTSSERKLKKLKPTVDEINRIYDELDSLSDEELAAKTDKFKEKIRERRKDLDKEISSIKEKLRQEVGIEERNTLKDQLDDLKDLRYEREQEVMEQILPEAFAVVKQACKRLLGEEWEVTGHEIEWGMVPYDVQLYGAIVLHEGNIAEMATGEGKTLAATMPLYLNALTGHSGHLITVNDYLAKRDTQWMGPLYNFLGLSVGALQEDMDSEERKEVYQKDIVYGTNNQFGFDYLRDNMAIDLEHQVQSDHYYTIVDEIDSLAIDEARTPLIISGPADESTMSQLYKKYKPRVQQLVRKQTMEAKRRLKKAEKFLDEAEEEDDKDKKYRAGELLLMVQKSDPKNSKFMKIIKRPGVQKLINRVESDYMRDKDLHKIVRQLYFSVDEKNSTINLTDKGRNNLADGNDDSEVFKIPDLPTKFADIEDDESLSLDEKIKKKEEISKTYSKKSEINHAITQLLKGYSLFQKDVDYVVKEDKVVIVDEFTGRLQPGRRYSEGLHQALEAKEGVSIQRETQTLATVTIQNYLRMYNKLAGMTGTAETEANEFHEIYDLEVVVIPSNEPVRRIDYDDDVYLTRDEKYEAIASEVERLNEKDIPILVGTASVEVSETISKILKQRDINHSVLNAKHHKSEAEIISEAGQPGTVTIATNMAGRGTDIELGEGVVQCDQCKLTSDLPDEEETADGLTLGDCREDVPCGLHIIGTERHEARRIDRQLRGRSGRQGDPGASKFIISLEDDLMRIFGNEKIVKILDKMGMPEGEPVSHKMITSSISKAQKKVESRNFSIRKKLLEYDDVMSRQRENIYAKRQAILEGRNLKDEFHRIMDEYIEDLMHEHLDESKFSEEWDMKPILSRIRRTFLVQPSIDPEDLDKNKPRLDLKQRLQEIVQRAYRLREKAVGEELMRRLERFVLLSSIDELWKENLYKMDDLKEGINLRSYAQKDPIVEYKREAYDLFQEMLNDINEKALERLFKTRMRPEEEMEQVYEPKEKEHDEFDAYQKSASKQSEQRGKENQKPAKAEDLPGRNDPCYCGSGKKFKNCCLKKIKEKKREKLRG